MLYGMDYNLQDKACGAVKEAVSTYLSKVQLRKDQLKDLYDAVMNYYPTKEMDWASVLKVNFANYIEQLVTARLTAKSPKFIVSLQQNPREIATMYMKEDEEGFEDLVAEITYRWAPKVQQYLNMVFQEFDAQSVLRRGAKQLVRTGNVYGEVVYKYDLYRKKVKDKKTGEAKMVEKIAKEYPTIEIISLQELFFDPRYFQISEGEAVVRRTENVRLSQLYAMKDQEGMMNLDQIKDMRSAPNWDRQMIYQLLIPSASTVLKQESAMTLTVGKYYGYFSPTGNPEDELPYEIWTVNQALVIRYRAIASIPIVSAACFEDVEQHFGIGYVEPILGLQDEYNFKMNAAIEYINANLNHSYFFDPNSGIDPRMLMYVNAPGQIIPAEQGVQAAMEGLQEIPRKPIDQSYFAQQNEIRADMQTVSFTLDTGNPSNAAGSTDTATATRAKFFDSNMVYSDTLKHFEEWLQKLAYKILDCLAENYREDKIITKLGKHSFEWLHKDAFEESPLRYSIKVEVGSSSFDTIENRREDALAKLTVANQAKEAGVNLNMEEIFKDIFGTFEELDFSRYLNSTKSPVDEAAAMANMQNAGKPPTMDQMGLPPTPGSEMDLGRLSSVLGADPQLQDVSQLSKDVVQGNITPQL